MDGLRCSGNETRIEDCPFNGWGIASANCSHYYDVSVECCKSKTRADKYATTDTTFLINAQFD